MFKRREAFIPQHFQKKKKSFPCETSNCHHKKDRITRGDEKSLIGDEYSQSDIVQKI